MAWLLGHGVTAAEATGIYWELPRWKTPGSASAVKQIKGRKTDVADSMWLACQFGLATPSLVLPRQASARAEPPGGWTAPRNRIHKILDRDGIGGVVVFGVNGLRIL